MSIATQAPRAAAEATSPPRRAASQRERHVVRAVAALAAVTAAFADGQPTAWGPTDVILRAALAAAVTLAAGRARRWSWLVMAGVTTMVAARTALLVPSAAAFGIAAGSLIWDRRRRPYGAVVGALAAQVLLRLPDLGFHGASAAVALLATAPVLLSAYGRLAPSERRVVRVGALLAAGLFVVAGVAATVGAVRAADQARDAVRDARAGLAAVRNGQEAAAVTRLRAAHDAFDDARGSLRGPWVRATRGVPLVGPQVDALDELTSAGATLTADAADSADRADVDELRFRAGVIDTELIAGFEEPLEDAASSLDDVHEQLDDVDSGWLLPPVRGVLADFRHDVADARPEARTAIEGVRVAPGLLGADTSRRYFVAFLTPAELRGLGGFMGSWAELTAVDGDVELTTTGAVEDLAFPAIQNGARITEPVDYVRRWGRFDPATFPGDIPFSADFPTVARVLADEYQQAGAPPVDGVIALDPYALQSMLTFTGPIRIPDLDEPLTRTNAADVLLREQYVTFDERAERKDFLEDALREALEILTTGDVPGPRRVTEEIAGVVDEGRLMIHSFHPEEQRYFESIGVDGAFPTPPEGSDLLSVVTQNNDNNKIDVFLHRAVDYRAEVDPETGTVAATATIRLVNDAPTSGLPSVVIGVNNRTIEPLPTGTNRAYVSVHSALGLRGATLDGDPVSLEHQIEFGRPVYSRYVDIPPGGEVELQLQLEGPLDVAGGYSLTFAGQPLVNDDEVDVAVVYPEGWDLESEELEVHGPEASVRFTGPRDRRVSVQGSR